jgi:hypothetical protein
VGLPAPFEVGHRPPDRDTPFWVGCGAVLELVAANAAQSFDATRVHHAARRGGGSMAPTNRRVPRSAINKRGIGGHRLTIHSAGSATGSSEGAARPLRRMICDPP